MASSNGKFASTSWTISLFKDKWSSNKNKDIFGSDLYFGSSRFVLFYKPVDLWKNDKFGIILKELIGKQPLEVNLKLWFQNSDSRKFQNSVQKHTFNKVDDRCEFNLNLSDVDHNPLSIVFGKNNNLYIHCEITDLNYQAIVPITDYTQKFHQNMWSMYEQELHDAVIKVGQTEFKILKALFMAQSEFFKNMFTLDFKERETSTGKIEDVSEHTMKQIIKWMYTCQIDDQDSIEDLFEAADKCQIHLLKTACAEIMIKRFDNSNAFRRLILAVIHNDNQLKDAALSHINKIPKNEAMTYLVSSEWFEFVRKNPAISDEVRKTIAEKLKI